MTIDQLNKLTDEEVRCLVAERLGWTRVKEYDYEDSFGEVRQYWGGVQPEWADGVEEIPNFTESRDACEEFEKTITDEIQQRNYVAALWQACGLESTTIFWTRENFNNAFILTTAEPMNRCLAFLAVTEREEG